MDRDAPHRELERLPRKERRRLRKLQREEEARGAHRRARLRRWSVRAGVALACFGAGGGGFWLWAKGGEPRLPKVGDHWHAPYEVVLCGKEQPKLAYSPGNIHTHGDGVIHVHPERSEEGGMNANLGRFFANSKVTFTEGLIRYPDGRIYRDGDPCPDGKTGRLRFLVNGTRNAAMERYVPRDGDRIRVEFGPE